MGQIEKRKKGRPSKADLARRAAEAAAAAAAEAELRRSSRRRSVNYNLDDFDDYEEEEREEKRRREKKLKVLLGESAPSRTRRVPDSDDDDVENEIEEDAEERERKAGSNEADSAPGTPSDLPMGVELPDKKTLELILDKLQKKDTYGVFAEPVDPDELPDYHDVIERPMDFATVRKKLGKGSYSTLEQFEIDVLLISSNAMQYNAPDTIYHKQAFSIQELAKRKFQRLRLGAEQYEKELQSEQKPESNSLGNEKQIKKPISRIPQETVASNLSSGATLAILGDLQPGSTAKASGFEMMSNVDESVDGTTIPSDNNLDKTEDLPSGRGHSSRFGRKPLMHDDNRRATYNISTQLVSRPELAFSTFDGEIKQLVAVGLQADHSYARSLARFAAMLGPVAWNVASKRIEQALPPGFKFGRGWVGEFEPVLTPVLVTQKCPPKESVFCQELHSTSNPNNDGKLYSAADAMHKNPIVLPTSEGKSTLFGAPVSTTHSPSTSYSLPSKPPSSRGEFLEVKSNIPASVSYQAQNLRAMNIQPEKNVKKGIKITSPPSSANQSPREFSTAKHIPDDNNMPGSKPMEPFSEVKPNITASVSYQAESPRAKNIQPEKKVKKGVQLNSPSLANQSPYEFSTVKHVPNGTNMPGSKPIEPRPPVMNPSVSVPLQQPQNNGFVEVTNRKLPGNGFDINRTVSLVNDRNQMSMPANCFLQGQEQGITDPVQLMRKLTENAQKQQKSVNHLTSHPPLVPHSKREDPSNASSAAARAWMSIGAGNPKSVSESTSVNNRSQIFLNSLHSPTQLSRFRNDFPPDMQFHPMNNFPIHGFVAPQFQTGNEAQFQNRPPVVFPQLVTNDLSRFQMQSSPRQGSHLQRQPSQKQETTIPPDLNLVFQSSGSPGRQSSGVQVDSQQPDLALQL